MEGDKYQALASNSVSQERRKFELLVMEASSNPGRHQDFVVELLPLLSEDPHFLGCKYFGSTQQQLLNIFVVPGCLLLEGWYSQPLLGAGGMEEVGRPGRRVRDAEGLFGAAGGRQEAGGTLPAGGGSPEGRGRRPLTHGAGTGTPGR